MRSIYKYVNGSAITGRFIPDSIHMKLIVAHIHIIPGHRLYISNKYLKKSIAISFTRNT